MIAAVRALLGSWALGGIGWFALEEASMRFLLDGGTLLALLLLGWNLLPALALVVVVHTGLWFLLYGGYHKAYSLRGARRPLPRLEAFRATAVSRVTSSSHFRSAMLYGSSGRDTMNERSDVDVVVVPGRPWPIGVLALWALRAWATIRRMPLEASSADLERYLSFRGYGEGAVWIKSRDTPHPSVRDGALVALSGIDGSGKTTVAKSVIERLRDEGVAGRYFYGHRQYFREGERNLSAAIAFKAIWRHLGRPMDDLRRHPRVALLLDLLTAADYTVVQVRLSRLLRPGTLVMADRYVADVVVYLRSLGPARQGVEGLLLGFSFPPDVALLFNLDASVARTRKREEDEATLGQQAAAYADLAPRLGLRAIDATRTIPEVTEEVLARIRETIDLGGGREQG